MMELDGGIVVPHQAVTGTQESFQLEPLDHVALAQEREARAVGRPRKKRKLVIDERLIFFVFLFNFMN
jgi:hypothetical protein